MALEPAAVRQGSSSGNGGLRRMSTLEKNLPAVDQAGKQAWQHRLRRSGYFVGAVLLHLLIFLLVATLVVFKAPKPEQDATFGRVTSIPVKVPPPPAPPASGDAAMNPDFEPQPVIVPVTTPPQVISTAKATFSVDASKLPSQSLSHLPSAAPQGTGMGHSGASGNMGPGNDYGSGTGNGAELVGHLYDLKQTPDRKPTDIMDSASNGLNFLRTFVKDWNMSTLANYYEAPGTIYASQICIRERHSDESTKAFGVSGTVDPKRWIIVYDGMVAPPESGTYRFVGWADDFLMVRWNGANILDACYDGEGLDPSANDQGTESHGNKSLKYGKWVQMDAGTPVPIKILIGEGPGGYSGFILMIEKQGDNSQNGDYPLFQVQDAPIPDFGGDFTFTKKKLLFQPSPLGAGQG